VALIPPFSLSAVPIPPAPPALVQWTVLFQGAELSAAATVTAATALEALIAAVRLGQGKAGPALINADTVTVARSSSFDLH
jgi:hypothetical protein